MQTPSSVTFDIDSLHALRFSRPRDMISVQRFAQRFGYALGQLETACGLEPGQLHANPFCARAQSFMRHALDVVALRMTHGPELEEAIAWFRHAVLPEHGGRTPEQIVAHGEQRLLLKPAALRGGGAR